MSSIVIALSLVAVMTTPAMAADEQSVPANLNVNTFINITLVDAGTAGINFGSVDPGATSVGDVDQTTTTPAIRVCVGMDTNVQVDIWVRADVDIRIDITNWQYSTTYTAEKMGLRPDYVSVYTAAERGDNKAFYHWIDIPEGTMGGSYAATVYYKAVVTGTPTPS